MVSNYLKMTFSTPWSDSDTPRPKNNFFLGFCALFATSINDWTAFFSMHKWPYRTHAFLWLRIINIWYIFSVLVTMYGPWPIDLGRFVKAHMGEEVPGSNPWASQFWVCIVAIYKFNIWFVRYSYRWHYPYPNGVTCGQVWRGLPDLANPQNYIFFQFCSQTVIVHFPLSMWQPLIGTCGDLSLGHIISYQVIMSCHHSTSSCHISVRTIQTATWHDPIGPWIGLKMPKLGDMWKPLVLPHHHDDVIHTNYDSSPTDWAMLTKLWPWINFNL